jgi:hypothetical protein
VNPTFLAQSSLVIAALAGLVGATACDRGLSGSGDGGVALPPGAVPVPVAVAPVVTVVAPPPPAGSVAVSLQPVSFAPIVRMPTRAS